MHKISVVIPSYEMYGKGVQFLERSLDMLELQTFRDFEVVVSDNSAGDGIRKLCLMHWNFPIHYSKNSRVKNMSGNTNNGILKATGELIKILFLDDYLAHENSLKEIHDHFKGDWLVTGCSNHMNPYYSVDVIQGKNTIGSPSVLTMRNKKPLLLDETLSWVVDCDYYKRLFDKFGLPTVLNTNNVVIGVGDHQVTNHLSDNIKQQELDYLWRHYSRAAMDFSVGM